MTCLQRGLGADQVDRGAEVDVEIVPLGGLVEGVKMGSGSLLASCRPAGMVMPCTVPDRSYSA